jgi:hypothetical protein
MNYEFTVFVSKEYSLAMHRAVRRIRAPMPADLYPWLIRIVFTFLLCYWLYMLISEPLSRQAITLVVPVMLIFGIVMTFRSSYEARRAVAEHHRKFGEYEEHCRISEEGYESTSPAVQFKYSWDKFDALHVFPEFWFLQMGETKYYPLPADKLTPEVRDFLVRKITEHGGKVRGK